MHHQLYQTPVQHEMAQHCYHPDFSLYQYLPIILRFYIINYVIYNYIIINIIISPDAIIIRFNRQPITDFLFGIQVTKQSFMACFVAFVAINRSWKMTVFFWSDCFPHICNNNMFYHLQVCCYCSCNSIPFFSL